MDGTLEPKSGLTEVSTKGIQLIAHVTKYLSTLAHPIDVLEELIAVISVTSNLLISLNSTITRFQSTINLEASFVKLLCHDISTGFSLFAHKIGDAQRLGAFEINNVGLVRVPRHAWAYIMGGELQMAQFRSRLYVEKYRVRVLIDAVAWQGLSVIGPLDRTAQEERELHNLTKMLPLVAERLMGVWNDYKPRIENGGRKVERPVLNTFTQSEQKSTVALDIQEKKVDFKQRESRSARKLGYKSSSSTVSIASNCSSCSTSSSITVTDDTIYEQWLLCENKATKTIVSKSYIFGIPLVSSYHLTPSSHYVKSLSSHPSESKSLMSIQHLNSHPITKIILSLPPTAQAEIQRLIESRESASSNDNIKRSFEVVALQSQMRTYVSRATGARNGKWWEKTKKGEPVEWLVVLQGTTVDRKARTTPCEHEDAWNPKTVNGVVETRKQSTMNTILQQQHHMQMQMQMLAQQIAARDGNAMGHHVLRHVEQKRILSAQEAEVKMVKMLADLLKVDEKSSGEVETENRGV